MPQRSGQFKNSWTKNPMLMPTFFYFEQIAVRSLWGCFCVEQAKTRGVSMCGLSWRGWCRRKWYEGGKRTVMSCVCRAALHLQQPSKKTKCCAALKVSRCRVICRSGFVSICIVVNSTAAQCYQHENRGALCSHDLTVKQSPPCKPDHRDPL